MLYLNRAKLLEKMIDELEKCLSEEKAFVVQLKLELNTAKEELAQSQSQV